MNRWIGGVRRPSQWLFASAIPCRVSPSDPGGFMPAFPFLSRFVLRVLLVVGLSAAVAAPATAGVLQCVPYARAQSGIDIRGNALTWWDQAAGRYRRGAEPQVGAVLAF